MNLGNLLFSFDGRINRGKYWLAALIWFAASAVIVGGAFGMSMASGSMMIVVIAALIVILPSVVSGIALGVKRLHDRDKSGWWLLVFYLAPGILESAGPQMGAVGLILSLAGFGVSVWAFVELGCLRGTVGPNAYGPDPLEAGVAQPA